MKNLPLAMLSTGLFLFGCSLDLGSTGPVSATQTQDSAWVGTWLWTPDYPVKAETLIFTGLQYSRYWSWDEYREDGSFLHIQSEPNQMAPEAQHKVVEDSGRWNLLAGAGFRIERRRTACKGYNRVAPPGTDSSSIPCRILVDTVVYRLFDGTWFRNRNQISQRWRRVR